MSQSKGFFSRLWERLKKWEKETREAPEWSDIHTVPPHLSKRIDEAREAIEKGRIYSKRPPKHKKISKKEYDESVDFYSIPGTLERLKRDKKKKR